MPAKEKVIEGLDFCTDLLSTRARALAGGVLGLSWVFILANATGGQERGALSTVSLMPPIVLALACLLLDLAQYWFGYVFIRRHLSRMERERTKEAKYNYRDPIYRLRTASFHLKLAFMMVSVVWLLALLLQLMF